MRAALFILVFLIAFLATAAARLPLSVVWSLGEAEERGLSAAAVEGTIWNGQVKGLAVNGRPVGDVRVAGQASDLLAGKLGASVELFGQGQSAKGWVGAGADGRVIVRDARWTGDLSAQRGLDPRLANIGGRAILEIVAMEFDLAGGAPQCVTGEGAAWTDALTSTPEEWRWTGPALSGPLTCSDGAVSVRLDGAQDGDVIAVAGALLADMTTSVEASVETEHPRLSVMLPLLGFDVRDGAYVYERRAYVPGAR